MIAARRWHRVNCERLVALLAALEGAGRVHLSCMCCIPDEVASPGFPSWCAHTAATNYECPTCFLQGCRNCSATEHLQISCFLCSTTHNFGSRTHNFGSCVIVYVCKVSGAADSQDGLVPGWQLQLEIWTAGCLRKSHHIVTKARSTHSLPHKLYSTC